MLQSRATLMQITQPLLLLLLLLLGLARAQNCGNTGQCSLAWRTYQLNLESAWAAYAGPPTAAANSGAGDCSMYADVLRSDLAQFEGGGIRREAMEAVIGRGGVLYQVIGGHLYRNASACGHFLARCAGIEHYLLRAAPRLARDAEFAFNVADYPIVALGEPPLPVMSFSKSIQRHRDILYPAWSFSQGGPCLHPIYSDGIGDWNGTREQLLASAQAHPWANKTDLAYFRGSRTAAERDTVVLLSLAKPDLFDARYTKNQAYKSAMDTLNMEPAPYVSLPHHCRYRYLINMRGVAASFRLRHVLLCGSLVMHVGSDWIEFFYPALRPWVHYVPVTDSMRDAEDKLLFLRANQNWAQRIAAEGAHFVANHLRDADVACYWLRLLRRVARMLDYSVALRDGMQLVQ